MPWVSLTQSQQSTRSFYVVRRWSDRFALWFEWLGVPCGAGGIAGTLIGLVVWGSLGSPYCITQSAIMVLWFAIGLWRPVHRRFGFARNTLWIAPP
jgi:hypothetical protein